MEVNRIQRTGTTKATAKSEGMTEKITFTEIMQGKRDAAQVEKFNQRLVEIEKQGQRLAEHRTVEDLNKFKKLVKDMMDDTVKFGLSLEERQGFNRRGRSKIYKIIKEVDKKLLEVTDAVLDSQKKNLEVLSLVGEIKGLLINVYT
ncbi:hypothetical protein BHU72_00535 [Desulfuribacillus stibiiarsenatis]|uniref:UDP-N-acetylenolpyruvoylglucosamine reductase n=1 Tax=Desulfuribacillus stibiiarsenatis TaxID=1390249 RepID=A0A1E5L9G0_9FIRM|nr:YaaR family protein [Desulfuribacillus stibiiarsenatis]OEH86792.1 hypothetical protein BHU72_00535 [Desulfuribacillus stibiiarsenatis]